MKFPTNTYILFFRVKVGVTVGLLGLCMAVCAQSPARNKRKVAQEAAVAGRQGVIEHKGVWYHAGDTIYGYKNYIKLVVGDAEAPLLLGIPHDGTMVGIPEIPVTGSVGRDINTKPFTLAIAELFKEDTGIQPWIIINEIHRKRVDPNTYPTKVDARYGADTEGRRTYDSYHELLLFVRTTMARNLSHTAGGLFIDMHGHAHKYANAHKESYASVVNGKALSSDFIEQSELGYALSSTSLEKPDSFLNMQAAWSSIYALAEAHPSVPFSALIRGPYSLGALLQAEGVTSVPSDALPLLDRDAKRFGVDSLGTANRRPYFNGGFVTRRYGTAQQGEVTGFADNISAVQIETPGITVRNNAAIRARAAHKFKRAIIEYLNHWYGYNFSNSSYPYF